MLKLCFSEMHNTLNRVVVFVMQRPSTRKLMSTVFRTILRPP